MCLEYTNQNFMHTYAEYKGNQSKLSKRKAKNFNEKLKWQKNSSLLCSQYSKSKKSSLSTSRRPKKPSLLDISLAEFQIISFM